MPILFRSAEMRVDMSVNDTPFCVRSDGKEISIGEPS